MVSPQTNSGGRQPILFAALAFAVGIATGVHAWRPPLWWVVAWIVFTLSGTYWLGRRGRAAFVVALGALFFSGALLVQVRSSGDTDNSGWTRFADGTEAIVTAHVTKEGTLQNEGSGSVRQRIEVETEQITRDVENVAVKSGLGINVYQQPSKSELGEASPAPVGFFPCGERLRFPAKISLPRNYRNPGAFDYRGYLAENGIVALGSTKAASVEVLPGFSGSRVELWRTRIHHRIIEKVHALWPTREAALMDAMVIGEMRSSIAPPGPTSSARALITSWSFRG